MSGPTQADRFRYAIAVASVVVATGVRLLLDPALGNHLPYSTFYVAVILTAWYGGFRPAMLTLALGIASAAFFFVPPRGSFMVHGLEHQLGLVIYLFVGVSTALFAESLRQARLRADSRLAAMVESSQDAIFSVAFDGTIESWNAGAEQLFGYSAAEIIGMNNRKLLPPDRIGEFRGFVDCMTRGETLAPIETVRLHKDARRLDVWLCVSPIKERSGRMRSACVVARDISQRKRMEQAARLLADVSVSLSSLIDHKTTLETVARLAVPAFADWCLVDMTSPEGQPRRVAAAHADPTKVEQLNQLVDGFGHHSPTTSIVAQVLYSGRPQRIAQVTDPEKLAEDDQQRAIVHWIKPLSLLCVPLVIRQRLLGALQFVISESDHRYTVEDLDVAQDLAHRVSIAIDNAQLYRGLRQADRHKDEFIAILAHELLNPLASARAALDLMRAKGDDAPTVEWAHQVIGREVDHLVRLVNDLLDVSRIAQGKIQLRRQRVEVTAIVHRAIEIAGPSLESKQHELQLSLCDEPIWVDGDAVRLAQVLANLLNNAAKYTQPRGQIQLSVRREGQEVAVSVGDNGIGIDSEMLPRIFERFTQADQAVRWSQGGLGLGLWLVRNLTELHGGSITAESAGRGCGSQFTLRLPIANEITQQPAAALAQQSEPPQPAEHLARSRPR